MTEFDSESLDRYFLELLRASDYEGAVQFFMQRTRKALQSSDEETATHASQLLIASLIAAGPNHEALALLWQVVNTFPAEAYLRSSLAELLLSLKQPAQALDLLDSIFDKLIAEESSRHAALGLRGTILFALGRMEEAEHCFLEMLQPSLRRMYPSAFDLRLVEALISARLRKEECDQYLKIVYQRAEEFNDPGVLARAEELLGLLR
jgi:tetratricopeptide (TPR) repeat protein